MKLHLIDHNRDLIKAWQEEFVEFPDVTVEYGDILEQSTCSVVSPANSYGFMDGGIDRLYRNYFGPQIEEKVQEAIGRRPEGHLPIGAALIIATGNKRIPYLIVAPTMIMPEAVPAINAYRALRAVLREVTKIGHLINDVFCPGLATGVGQVSPKDAAIAMREAWADSIIQFSKL